MSAFRVDAVRVSALLAVAARMSAFLLSGLLVVAAAASAGEAQPAGRSAPAAVARPNMLVTTEWLSQHLRDADLVVLHVGNAAQFNAGHIAGSRRVGLADISSAPGPDKLTLEMLTPEQISAWAESQGIGDRSRVVIVPHNDTLQSATRVFLTLAYFGAIDRVSLLDGGF